MSVIIGLTLISYTAWDLFHELFHPSDSGRLSGWVRAVVWPLCRSASGSGLLSLAVAGPSMLVMVIVLWFLLFSVGWALVFWPYLSTGFYFSTQATGGFQEALYVSLVTLATLGYGDITPTRPLLRLAAGVEAFIGFALLTSSVTWILSTYPVVSRRRSFAAWITAEESAAEAAGGWSHVTEEHRAAVLRRTAVQLARIRTDLMQFPITYHFHAASRCDALPYAAPVLLEWANAAQHHASGPIRDAGRAVHASLEQFAAELRGSFLPGGSEGVADTLMAYAADHRQTPERAPHRD